MRPIWRPEEAIRRRRTGWACPSPSSSPTTRDSDAIQQAYFDHVDGIIINPAAYTHTSVALLDAVKAVGIPTVEVHVSDPDSREEFRRVSYIRAACAATIRGHGLQGYVRPCGFCGADA